MSAVDSITGGTGATTGITSGGLNQIQSEDFLKIMIKELQQQDPFEPVSSKDLLSQVGQIRDIQSALELSETLKELAVSQKLAAGGALLGKLVLGLNSDGDEVSGVAVSIKMEAGQVILELDSGQQLPLDNVIRVTNDTESSPEGDT